MPHFKAGRRVGSGSAARMERSVIQDPPPRVATPFVRQLRWLNYHSGASLCRQRSPGLRFAPSGLRTLFRRDQGLRPGGRKRGGSRCIEVKITLAHDLHRICPLAVLRAKPPHSKLAAAVVAGFMMGQACAPGDRNPVPLPCECRDATGSEPAPRHLPDRRAAPSPERRPIRRGGAAHRFMECDAASTDAATP
jgi:hypothetical protein